MSLDNLPQDQIQSIITQTKAKAELPTSPISLTSSLVVDMQGCLPIAAHHCVIVGSKVWHHMKAYSWFSTLVYQHRNKEKHETGHVGRMFGMDVLSDVYAAGWSLLAPDSLYVASVSIEGSVLGANAARIVVKK